MTVAHPPTRPLQEGNLLILLVGVRNSVEGTEHLPDVQSFVDVRLSNLGGKGIKREANTLMYERLRSQANSGLLEWGIRDLGERVRTLLLAERARHLWIRDFRRGA